MFTPIAWSYGVEFMKKDGDKWKATFDSPEAEAALQYVKDLKWKYDVLPSNTLIDNAEYYKVIGTGNAGIFINSGDYSAKTTTYGMKIEQMGAMAMPSGPKKRVTLMGGGIMSVSSKATEKQIEGAVKWASTQFSSELNEESKINSQNSLDVSLEQGLLIGVNTFSPWKADSKMNKYLRELRASKSNVNPNQYKLYNEFIDDLGDCELKVEEPVCAQELYATLDNCIQEVLINKDADCAAILKKACSDFQKNYLDNIDY